MRRYFVAALFVLYAIPADAAPLCSTALGSNVTTLNASGGCDLGPFTFNAFAVLDVTGNGGPVLLTGVVSNPAQQLFTLVFNAQLGDPQIAENLHLTYQVSGALVGGIGFSATGSPGPTGEPSGLRKVACSIAGIDINSGACTSGGHLFSMQAIAGQSIPVTGIPAQHITVGDDIFAAAGGSLTTFTQSFRVPEPTTLLLTGAGLLGIAIRRARRPAKS